MNVLRENQENHQSTNQVDQYLGVESDEDRAALRRALRYEYVRISDLKYDQMDKKNVYEELNFISFGHSQNWNSWFYSLIKFILKIIRFS